jgi:replication factor A1
VKGACGEHGRVDGKYDLRIKAVFSPFGGNELIDLIIGAGATEALTGLSVEKAKEMAMESLDTAVVEDQFRRKLVGRYYQVAGAMLAKNGMLVESIKPINICTQDALADALKEAETGGN